MLLLTPSYIQKSEKEKLLVMYSGGLDSLAMLYLLLTEPEYEKYDILVQYLGLKDVNQRRDPEYAAVRNAIAALSALEETSPFFVMPVLEIDLAKALLFYDDYQIILFFAGLICQNRYQDKPWKHIRKVAMGVQKTDEGWRKGYGERAQEMFTVMQKETKVAPFDKKHGSHEIEIITPINGKSKEEMLVLLPESVRYLFWSCREPLFSQGRPFECNVCKTCREIRPLREKLQKGIAEMEAREETEEKPDHAQEVPWQHWPSK